MVAERCPADIAGVPVNSEEIKLAIGRRIQRFRKIVDDGMRGGDESNPLRRMFRQWVERYMGFVRTRFTRASRGDGTWPDLAYSTKLQRARALSPTGKETTRRKQFDKKVKAAFKSGGDSQGAGTIAKIRENLVRAMKFAILIDKRFLFRALETGNPSQKIEDIPNGIKISFAAVPHPGKGNMTIARLAAIHHFGEGHVPARKIFVQPDDRTKRGMMQDLRAASVKIEAMSREINQ